VERAGRQLSGRIALVGIGETRYERRSARPLMTLLLEAARAALADAGLAAPDVDGLIAPGTSYHELHELARELGVGRQFFHTGGYSGGAAVVSAPLHAALAIEAGLARTVLCCRGLAWGSERRGNVGQTHADMPMKAAFEIPLGWYPQVVHFAGMARRHMEVYGTTEAQLGAIAVAFRRHAALSDNALLRDKPLTLEGYLAEPYVAEPFRVADCCLVNDGAGAFVMTTIERARDLRHPATVVLGVGCGVSEEGEYSSLRADYLATPAVHSAPRAFAMAGLTPADVDFVTLYDNFTGMVIQQLEDMGFCRRGEGGPFVEDGRIALGGALPVNPSGGQLAQAFLLSMNNVCETVRQLRGAAGPRQIPETRVGLVAGYSGSEHATLLLGRA
jgi:acetyl-CoA acetyltransferase